MVRPIDEVAREFDFHDEALDDAFDTYQRLRSECPVGHSEREGGFWFFTEYDHVFKIEHDTETFSSAEGVLLPPFYNPRPMIPIEIDPPMHAKYRRVLLGMFSPKAVDQITPFVHQVARDLMASFGAEGTVDVAEAFARPLPMIVFCQMAGFPVEDYERFHDWVDRIIYLRTHDPEATKIAVAEVYDYFEALLRELAANPTGGDTVVDRLVTATIDGRPLSIEEQLDTAFLALLGGLETTAWAIRSALWHLAQHPEDRQRLVADPDLIPMAVEEFLRTLSPVQTMARTVTRDVEFEGLPLHAGEKVVIVYGSANRDEKKFEAPDEIRVDREDNPHLAFGIGPHRCLGANLGRREVTVALREFLSAFPEFSLAEGAVPVWHSVGPLPLVLGR